jgi:hypothetical protein
MKWEYLIADTPSMDQLQLDVDGAGTEGWELVSVWKGNNESSLLYFAMKRPIP